MNIFNKISIWLTSDKIGKDDYDNSYYESFLTDYLGRKRRYVIFEGINDPSKVPPMWHAWLRHMIKDIPSNQKEHWHNGFVPNLTGTKLSYNPVNQDGKRDKVTNDYIAWNPEK